MSKYTQVDNSCGYYMPMPMVIFKEIKLLGSITILLYIDLLAGVVCPK